MKTKAFLVVGLGNPGKEYEKTRHNLGFRVIEAFAKQKSWSFQVKKTLKGKVASGKWKESKVLLLLPTTYMNLSGVSVAAACRFYHIDIGNVMIVTDDIALPIGVLRYRSAGSAGGHNGLKSIEAYLGTNHYPRLRLGIGHPKEDELSSYVLKRFTQQEEETIPVIVDRANKWIEQWLTESENERSVSRTVTVIEKGDMTD